MGPDPGIHERVSTVVAAERTQPVATTPRHGGLWSVGEGRQVAGPQGPIDGVDTPYNPLTTNLHGPTLT